MSRLSCLFILFILPLFASEPIIIMLSHPRSLSTVFERVIREREDVIVLHEPFTYLYYLDHLSDSEESATFEPAFPNSYEEMKKFIRDLSQTKPVFIKDMGFAAMDRLCSDKTFTSDPNIHFMVLMRDPIKSLPSLYKIEPNCDVMFLGYESLAKVSEQLKIEYYLDADELEADPVASYAHFCERFHLPYLSKALHFTHPPAWEGKWYVHLNDSVAIEKSARIYPRNVEGDPLFEEIDSTDREKWLEFYRHERPFYDQLTEMKIKFAAFN